MRHLGFVIGVISLVVSFSAVAEDKNQKDYAVAFGVGSGSGLSVKKALSDSTWIFVNFSMSSGKTEGQYTSGGITVNMNATTRTYSMLAGVRQYLISEKLSKFIQLSLGENYSKSSTQGFQFSSRSYTAIAGYGLEYFIDPHLSVEGTVGLNYSYVPGNSANPGVTSRNMSFPVVGTAITYYW